VIESLAGLVSQALPINADQLFAALGIEQYRTWTDFAADDDEYTLAIPGYRQTRSFTCGYVAALSVARMFRPKVNAAKLYRHIQPDERWGTDAPSLRRGLRECGVGSSVRRDLTFAKIQASIFAGFPIVTLTKTTLLGTWHWVVIYGVGRRPNRVFVSGYQLFRSTVFCWPEFRAEWADPGFGIVCWGK
jgi:hypothetical protein